MENRRCRHYIHPNLPVMGAKGLNMFSEVFIGFNNGHLEDLRPLTNQEFSGNFHRFPSKQWFTS